MNVPSGYTALDLIGFTDKGDYDSTANYVENDLVHDSGRVWLCLIDDTKNVTPAVGANWKIWIDEAAYLSGLADTTITNPANGQVLRYDSTTSKWVNAGVDSTPTQSSDNLVQSGGVYTQLANKANTADLATVATTGAYSDLSGAPSLAAVATSGAYSDLSGTPTIPTVNDATLTIQKNGTNVETFTANSNTNKTANITVPDVINDLSDVNISSVANEDILAYDSTSSKWKNSGALGSLKQALANEEITRSKVSGHNFLPLTLENLKKFNTDGSWVGNTYTYGGMGFTVDLDEAGEVASITLNGTTGNSTSFFEIFGVKLPVDNFIVTGGINHDTYIRIGKASDATSSGSLVSEEEGDGASLAVQSGYYYAFSLGVRKNITLDNVKVYPMVRLSTDLNTAFTPYAMTNQQLTENALSMESLKNVSFIASTTSIPTWGANEVGSELDSLITTDGAFIGYLVSGGRCFVSGYRYSQNGSTYFTAVIVKFSSMYFILGIAGTYTMYQVATQT